ncbi:MAG: heme ABC transporter ATP-binding protein [Pseudomonadota bacterium]
MLDAYDITVTLGRIQVLHGLSFRAQPGKVSAIVGPNGSGKTTLLRAITGDVPFGGTVTLNGQDTRALKPWELASIRGVLPQSAVLAFPFTVIEVVRLGLQRGLSAAETDIPLAALQNVGLAHYANRFFQELSGGEQQRVHLARVLSQVWEPVQDGQAHWLLLDEPVASLDIANQLEVMEIARSYAAAGGGVVAVMHDLNLTAMFADHIAVLANGRCLAAGAADQVMTDDILSEAYGCQLRVNTPPKDPAERFVLPHVAQRL